ncbi:hypothetical protein D3C80_1233110 [compost metagenome]
MDLLDDHRLDATVRRRAVGGVAHHPRFGTHAEELVLGLAPGQVAVRIDHHILGRQLGLVGLRTGVVDIPEQFQAGLRNRERVGAGETLQAEAIVDQLGRGGVLLEGLADPVREAEVAVAGVHRHLEGFRILLEQRLLPVAELVGVLLHVLRGDGEQRLFVGVGVFPELAGALVLDVVGGAQPLAGELRNGPVGVAGLLGAGAGQVLAQASGFLGGNLGRYGLAECAENACTQQAGTEKSRLHRCFSCCYRLYLKLIATKSRSASGRSSWSAEPR